MKKNVLKIVFISLNLISSIIIGGLIGFIFYENIINEVSASNSKIIVDYNGGGNYTSIQAAIDNASLGDIIYVWKGTYYENVIINKSITLIGNGTENTIINGSGINDVVRITADWVNISNFTIIGSGIQYQNHYENFDVGIELYNVSNVTIKNNNCSNNTFGIYLYYSNSNLIVNNTCEFNNKSAIQLTVSNCNEIENNSFKFNNWGGIRLYLNCNSNTISNNNCSNNIDVYGIAIFDSENNIITNNVCSRNKEGLHFSLGANYNYIYNNIIFNNNIGIIISEYAKCNLLYHNNFISNLNQIKIYGEDDYNTWNNSNQEGNYWSDYTGNDTGNMTYGWDIYNKHQIRGDGIGDTKIPHLELDYYPFTNRLGWLKPGTPKLFDPGEFDSDGNYSITWNTTIRTIGYVLEEDNSSSFDSPTEIHNGSSLIFNISRKVNGTYYYRVKAYNEKFDSPWSNIVDIIVDWPPNIPKNLNASVFPPGNTLNLSWIPNIVDTKEYILEFKNETMDSWQQLDPITHPGFTFNHTGLVDGIRYDYRIQARDHRGQPSNFSEIISGIPRDSVPPAPPTGLRVTSTTYDSINLNWNPNIEDDLEGYHLFRSKVSNPSEWGKPIGTIPKGTEEYIDTGLTENTTYYYVLTAFDEVPNNSSYSNIAFGITILGQYGPVINNSQEDFSIPEDMIDYSTINLYYWFKDINNDALKFKCKGNENITVTIFQENGTVILIPKKDWNGKETLTFFSNDSIYEMSDNVTITITPVNDPPGPAIIIAPEEKHLIQNETVINFSATCTDPDLLYGDRLTFNWSSNISGKLGSGENLTDIILLPGHHQITLEVSDIPGETAIDIINITILPDLIPDNNITPEFDLELKIIPNEVMLYQGNQTTVKAIVTNLGNVDNIVTLTWDNIDDSKIEISVDGGNSSTIKSNKTAEFDIVIKAMDNAPTGALLINIEAISEKVNKNATLAVIIIKEKPISISKPDTVSENLWITVFLVIIVILILICIFLLMAKRKKRVKQEKQELPTVETEIEKLDTVPSTETSQEPLTPPNVQGQLPGTTTTGEPQVTTSIGQPPAQEQIAKPELPKLPPAEEGTTEPGTSEKPQEDFTETSSLTPETPNTSEPIVGEAQPKPAQISDELKESDESSDNSVTSNQE